MRTRQQRALARADLALHEKVIEQGLSTFVEVGEALLAIREGRKYRAAGYSTFDTYCRQRWGFSRQRAHQHIEAARVIRDVSTMVDTPVPSSERQVRPLTRLDDPDQVADAWRLAAETAANPEKPTGAEVARAVNVVRKSHLLPGGTAELLDRQAANAAAIAQSAEDIRGDRARNPGKYVWWLVADALDALAQAAADPDLDDPAWIGQVTDSIRPRVAPARDALDRIDTILARRELTP